MQSFIKYYACLKKIGGPKENFSFSFQKPEVTRQELCTLHIRGFFLEREIFGLRRGITVFTGSYSLKGHF